MFSKISKNDRYIIVIFCCVFAGSFSILFFNLFSKSESTSNQPVIAKTVHVLNDVRIKQKEQFDWSPSVSNNLIHYGDQIFSGDKSQITIQLNDGQRLKISENSLMKFDQKQGVKNFKIVFGSFTTQVKKDEMIEVTICGEKHLIKSTVDDEVVISNNDNCAAPQIKLKSNPVAIKPIKKKNKVIAKLTQKVLEKIKPPPPPPEPVIVPVALSTPVLTKNHIVMRAAERTKNIDWLEVQNASSYRVRWMDQNNLSNVLKSFETKNHFFEFQPEANMNQYAFSVEALSDKKEFLPSAVTTGNIQIEYSPIKILNPHRVLVMKARTSDQKAKPIDYQIQWSKTPRASYYNVEFSEDVDFQKIISVQKSNTNSLKSELTDFGKKNYRIKAYSQAGQELTKSTQTGDIDYSKSFDLLPPQINEKNKNQSLFFQKTEGQFIRLSWENSQTEKAPNHYLEISNTPDFKKIVKSYSTKMKTIVLNESIAQGQYYWRVKSYSADVISDWSSTAILKITSKRNVASQKK